MPSRDLSNDRDVLEFEHTWRKYPEAKERAISLIFEVPVAVYRDREEKLREQEQADR